MLNNDDLQLNTSNYNNINSFFSSAEKYQHTIKTSSEAGGDVCPSLSMAQATVCEDNPVNGIIEQMLSLKI